MVLYERAEVEAFAARHGRPILEPVHRTPADVEPPCGWAACLTKEEVAPLLGCGISTVNWLALQYDRTRGILGLRSYRLGRQRLYDPADIEKMRFVRDRTAEARMALSRVVSGEIIRE